MVKDITTRKVLDKLHREASKEITSILWNLRKGIFRKLKPEDMETNYIAIDRKNGNAIYEIVKKNKAKSIVEFGTSFGISTLYLGAAAKENKGRVITTEILKSKAEKAQEYFNESGLSQFIDLRLGDAMKTLQDSPNEIDFLFLDGWNDLYLPLLKMLEPRFTKSAMILADNTSLKSSNEFMEYVKANGHYEILNDSKISRRMTLINFRKDA